MNCPNPNCNNVIMASGRYCSECGTPVSRNPQPGFQKCGVLTGDIGYIEGNITDASRHGQAHVGSIVVQTGGQKAAAVEVCPLCGRRNDLTNTFRCFRCGRDYLCLRHQDSGGNHCESCVSAHETAVRVENLKMQAKAAEASEELEKAIDILDELILIDDQPQTITEWKSRLQGCIEAEKNQYLRPIENSLGMQFVLLPPGAFMMGSPAGEEGRENGERQHRVTLTKAYYMQTTPVTRRMWQAIMDYDISEFDEGSLDCPVECVGWHDVNEFINRLNTKEGSTRYRLPTEAEWEYACRAGSHGSYFFGNDKDMLSEYAWYAINSDSRTQPVAQKKANKWGFYDMHGNVCEWCEDWYENLPSVAVTDPTGPPSGKEKVVRGGCWNGNAPECRSAWRYGYLYDPSEEYDGDEYLGFRLAMDFRRFTDIDGKNDCRRLSANLLE